MTSEERSELHWAVVNDDLKKVNELLRNGADPNTADESGWTPLISAASAGFAYIVDVLLNAEANPYLKTKDGHDAFFYAVSKCNIQVVDLFIQNDIYNWKKDKYGATSLHRALSNKKCSIDFLQMVNRVDAPFTEPDYDGNTIIHLACYENRRDLVDWLVKNLELSVDEPKNQEGKSPKDLYPLLEFNA